MKRIPLQTERVLADVSKGIGCITFNRPEKMNAISYDMWLAIPDAIDVFIRDEDVRVVVVRGAGQQAFASGSDISEFEHQRSSSRAVGQYERAIAAAIGALKNLEKPLIAMIQGYCIGGGLAVALAADMRIAADDSIFSIPAARLGLGYDYQGVRDLVNVVGPAFAKEIFFTAGRFDARESEKMGLVNRIVPVNQLESAIENLTEAIVSNAPLTMRAAKAAIDEDSKDATDQGVERIDAMVRACFASQDYVEGRRAFMEKRFPCFRGK